MAENRKPNKNLIIGVCAVLVIAAVAIVLAIIFINKNKNGVNDSYFVSDNTKYVLSLDMEEDSEEEYLPLKTHAVYFYKGNQITDLKTYLEYKDASSAKEAYDHVKENDGASYKEIYVDGKYIVLVSNETEYENTTASDVKEQIDFIESLKNFDFETDDEDVETTVIDASE